MVCSLCSNTPPINHWPTLGGMRLELDESLKYLGVYLDKRFAFDVNAQYAASKAKHAVGVLYSTIGKATSFETFQKLYMQKYCLFYCIACL